MAVFHSVTYARVSALGDIPGATGAAHNLMLSSGNVATVAQANVGQSVLVVQSTDGTMLGQQLISGRNPRLAELSDGRIVVTTQAEDTGRYTVLSADATEVSVAGTALRESDGSVDLDSRSLEVTALDGGGFAIASADDQPGEVFASDVELRIYDAAGVPQSDPIVMETPFPGPFALSQGRPVITQNATGAIVMVWWDSLNDGTLMQRLFDTTGAPLGALHILNDGPRVGGPIDILPWEEGHVVSASIEGTFGFILPQIHYGDGQGEPVFNSGFDGTPPSFDLGISSPSAVHSQLVPLEDGIMGGIYRGFLSENMQLSVPGGVAYKQASDRVVPSGDENARDLSATYIGDSLIWVTYTVDAPGVGRDLQSAQYRVIHTHTSASFVDSLDVTDGGSEDVMTAGALYEVFEGGDGRDAVDYSASTSGVVVNLAAGRGFEGYATGDLLRDIEELIGSDHDDRLIGSSADDTLRGGDGADVLGGGAGADVMAGGLGNDTYIIDTPGDLIEGEIGYSLGGGIDTVRSFISYVQIANIEIVRLGTLEGTGNLNAIGTAAPGTLVGNAGNNRLDARAGNDQVNGNAGDDVLIGRLGRDVLVGGAGADTFVYGAVADSGPGAALRDVINGFERGADRIDLSAVDAVAGGAGNEGFVFIGSARFSGQAGELRTQGVGGANAVIIEADQTGDGVADMQIFVNLQTSMQASDFVL